MIRTNRITRPMIAAMTRRVGSSITSAAIFESSVSFSHLIIAHCRRFPLSPSSQIWLGGLHIGCGTSDVSCEYKIAQPLHAVNAISASFPFSAFCIDMQTCFCLKCERPVCDLSQTGLTVVSFVYSDAPVRDRRLCFKCSCIASRAASGSWAAMASITCAWVSMVSWRSFRWVSLPKR